jgi:aminoglycoside phosphotransferase family enzyme/predicted kinase
MDVQTLLQSLSKPEAYAHPVPQLEVKQTHISLVFLAGPFVYKVKKPVALGFVDYSTLEKRKHYCEEEVRLNRRLARDVYHGVVPIARTAGEAVQVEAAGDVVEWAVKMVHLPESATLRERLKRGDVTTATIGMLARRLAQFHASAERNERIASFGRHEVVASNARENFNQAASRVGTAVSRSVIDRLRALTERSLAELRSLMEARAARGVPRDTHGDVRLDHVYLFPDRDPPADLAIVDCIEFNERFRFADPVSDMAFLAMDLVYHGYHELAREFAAAYFAASDDSEGRRLLPFYTAYRAAVRAKVEGIRSEEVEIPETERASALAAARASWLLALGALEQPSRRPCLVLVGGLPGSGKSTLAQRLVASAGFVIIRSDLVRKELAGQQSDEPAPAPYGEGIYSSEWTCRTYAECMRRAEAELFQGNRVVVDASFQREENRKRFLEAAERFAVPAVLFLCRAPRDLVRARLKQRHGDASDADWSVFERALALWEDPSPSTQPSVVAIDTSGSAEHALAQVLQVLGTHGLYS